MANMAEKAGALTTQPNATSFRSYSGVMNLITPEMTEASKPNKNQPKETAKDINVIRVVDFIRLN